MLITDSPKLASEYILQGKLVLFPTETVYGLGASAWNESACLQIYEVKKRPRDNPFIVHLSSVAEVFQYGEVANRYRALIEAFSPGPIAYILPKRERRLFSTGLPTVGLRVPDHSLAREFLALAGPVSAPSANLSGKPSITQKTYLREVFSGKVDLLLDGNDPNIGVESTVLDLSSENPVLLRPGKITFGELLPFLPDLKKNIDKKTENPLSPGLKYRHYSPESLVYWYEGQNLEAEHSAFIGFSPVQGKYTVLVRDNLEYMKELYTFFIECDRMGLRFAYCERPKSDEFADTLSNRIGKAIEKG